MILKAVPTYGNELRRLKSFAKYQINQIYQAGEEKAEAERIEAGAEGREGSRTERKRREGNTSRAQVVNRRIGNQGGEEETKSIAKRS